MEQRSGYYEVMFLASQAQAAAFGELIEHIKHLLDRAKAEIVAMCKWDERRLAFPIDKHKRGVYILAYIKVPKEMITKLERDVNISEQLLRMLVTTADHLTIEEMKSADAREALATEAKLRAERGDDTLRTRETVRAGAPTQPGSEEADEPEADTSDEPA